MMKNNMQDKIYKIIKTYFGMRKTKCAYTKHKEGHIIIEEEKLAGRRKEYVDPLYKDDRELLIQMKKMETHRET